MAAKKAMQAQMDALMGSFRNEVPKPEDANGPPRWQAQHVCKKYLVKFCPNDLFVNTKSDLGKCLKVHDDKLKDMFQNAKDDVWTYKYSQELLHELEQLTAGVDRQIRRFAERMSMALPSMDSGTQEKLNAMTQQIKSLQTQIEQLGEQGEVEKAEEANKQVADLLAKKVAIESAAENDPLWQKERGQTICDICGCIAQSTDNDIRKQNHLDGKQHTGFILIRDTIKELKDALSEIRSRNPDAAAGRQPTSPSAAASSSSTKDKEDRDKDRSDRGRDSRDKDRDREKERERDRDRRDSGGNRDRSRERDSRRDRDREKSGVYNQNRDYHNRPEDRRPRDRSRERRH